MDSVGRSDAVDLLVLFYEGNEGRPLDLDGLARPVVEGNHKVEKVRLPKVGRRLLLKVGTAQAWGDPVKKIMPK